jgi:hypothetical protein
LPILCHTGAGRVVDAVDTFEFDVDASWSSWEKTEVQATSTNDTNSVQSKVGFTIVSSLSLMNVVNSFQIVCDGVAIPELSGL